MQPTVQRRHQRRPVVGYPPRVLGETALRLLDLSEGGVGLELDRPVPKGSRCWIQLGEHQEAVRLPGDVKWCRRNLQVRTNARRYRVGVQIQEDSSPMLLRAISERSPFRLVCSDAA